MLALSRWKILLVLASALFGLIFTLPNLLPDNVLETVPAWLPHDRLSLGLDLRGGSYLLMEVDTNALNQERLTNLTEDVRTKLRVAQINFDNLGLQGDVVSLHVPDAAQYQQAFKLLSNQIGGQLATGGRDVGIAQKPGQIIEVSYVPQAAKEAAEDAVTRSIEIIRRRIDAPANDLDRPGDGIFRRLLGRLGHVRDLDDLAWLLGDADVAAAGGELAADLVGEQLERLLVLSGVRHVEADHVALKAEVVEIDLGHAQLGAHVLGEVGQPLLVEGVGVHLHQEVGAAAQVEAEAQAVMRQPGRDRLEDVVRQQIRQGEDQPEESRSQDEKYLPAGEREHVGACSGLGIVGGRRLAAGDHVGDHRLDHLDGDVLGDLEAHLGLFDADHLALHATGQHRGVTALDGSDLGLVQLPLLLLWPENHEIEQHQDGHEDQHLPGADEKTGQGVGRRGRDGQKERDLGDHQWFRNSRVRSRPAARPKTTPVGEAAGN